VYTSWISTAYGEDGAAEKGIPSPAALASRGEECEVRRVRWWNAWLLTSLIAASRTASAQVNAEAAAPSKNALKAGFSGGLDGSLSISKGNIDLVDVGGAGRVQYQTLYAPARAPGALPWIHYRTFVTASGRFAERADATFISQAFLFGRWTAMWFPRVGTDLFLQFQFNELLRLRRRSLAGAGLRIELVHDPAFVLSAGAGYMIEYEKIDVAPGASDVPTVRAHRLASSLTARLALFDGALLAQNTLFFQPRFDGWGDVRVLDDFQVVTKVTEVLSLGTTISVFYDSAPPTGVLPVDLRLTTTVRLSF
jgi:hypothetical protein